MTTAAIDRLTIEFQSVGAELRAYVSRLVLRPAVAEELVQTTWLRCREAVDRLPTTSDGVRAWLFTVATRLALDEQKRHATWREDTLLDLQKAAEADAGFVARSQALAGSPETRSIAREHLVVCLACTAKNLPERRAAALLLKEVHGFSNGEIATMLDASATQVKNWLQEARAVMTARYAQTCALITKSGACHQCVELDGFLEARQGPPISPQATVDERLAVARAHRDRPWGPWHRMMFELLDELTEPTR